MTKTNVSVLKHFAMISSVCFIFRITVFAQPQSPPTLTVAHTSTGPIAGGVAQYTDGSVYFSTLSTPSSFARVTGVTAANVQKWVFNAPGAGSTHNMWAIPALNATGTRLYIGSDAGNLFCVNTATGSAAWTYTVPTGTDRRIRSGVALDPTAPSGSTVYFHCNNTRLYAINADNGTLRWSAITGNIGAPVDTTWHTETVSSSPIVGADGTVYVGSSDGSVYAFNPANGAQRWRVILQRPGQPVEPMEATLAMDQDGILYAATRRANVYAINPIVALADPANAIEWVFLKGFTDAAEVGFVASPVVDQSGFLYTAHFDSDSFQKIRAMDGTLAHEWNTGDTLGKPCQTPALNQNGLLIVATSRVAEAGLNKILAYDTGDHSLSDPVWSIEQPGNNQSFGMFLGSPAVGCTIPGRVYVADFPDPGTPGKLYRFDSGAPLMAGEWPSFQSGNRRAGKLYSYPYVIAELPRFYQGTDSTTVRNVSIFGLAAGQTHGYYNYPIGAAYGWSAAIWKNLSPIPPGGRLYAASGRVATAISANGDVAGYSGTIRPLVWPDAANRNDEFLPVELATPGFSYAYASDINASGTVIGYAYNSSSLITVFRWTKSDGTWSAEDLGTTAGNQIYAYAITDAGKVAGRAKFAAVGQFRAYHTPIDPENLQTEAIDLGTFGGLQSEAWDIHDESGTVGWAHNTAGKKRAFYLQTGAISG